MRFKLSERPVFRISAITLGAALAGYAAYPIFSALDFAPKTLWWSGIAAGAFIGGALNWRWGRAPVAGSGEVDDSIKTVFVGNLSFKASRDELESLFGRFGKVHSVRIMTDRATRRPRGFGFVEMEQAAANHAIAALDGKPLHGRELRVNEGRKKP